MHMSVLYLIFYLTSSRRIIYNFNNIKLILPQIIISFIISFILFYWILKKYPQCKLFFSLNYIKDFSPIIFSTPVDYSLKNNLCTFCIYEPEKNYSIFDIELSKNMLNHFKKLYGTIFIIGKTNKILIGKTKLYKKVYRDVFHVLYAILILITTFVMVLILLTKPVYIYFLIPHFKNIIDDSIGYLLTFIFPIEILSLIYLIQKKLYVYIIILLMIFTIIPSILKLPSAPDVYSNFYTVYIYISILIIINTLLFLFKFFNEKNLIKISYISAIITYFILYSIIIFNLIIFFYY